VINIASIYGSPKRGFCGVNDFALKLNDAIKAHGVNVKNIDIMRPSIQILLNAIKLIKKNNFKYILIQYPCASYGKSLVPIMFPFICKSKYIYVVHEFKDAHMLRKLVIILASWSKSSYFVFPQLADRVKYDQYFIAKKKRVLPPIKIGSNIQIVNEVLWSNKSNFICYFGLIRPNKGIEKFFEFVDFMNSLEQDKYKMILVGGTTESNSLYVENMLARCNDLNIKKYINLSETDVSELLSKTKYFILPYPDGLTLRRGSAIAAIHAGAIVFSIHSGITEYSLREITYPIPDNYKELYDAIEVIDNGGGYDDLKNKKRKKLISEHSWEYIAQQYIKIDI